MNTDIVVDSDCFVLFDGISLVFWRPGLSDYKPLSPKALDHLDDIASELESEDGDECHASGDSVLSKLELAHDFAAWPNDSLTGWISESRATGDVVALPRGSLVCLGDVAKFGQLTGNDRQGQKALKWLLQHGLIQSPLLGQRDDYLPSTAPAKREAVIDDAWLQPARRSSSSRAQVFFVHSLLSHQHIGVSGTETKIKSRSYPPLALGMIAAFLQQHVDRRADGAFDIETKFITDIEDVRRRSSVGGREIVFFSNYSWNLRFNQQICEAWKRVNPNMIAIHGGPSVPKFPQACENFMDENPHVDIAVRGEGEVTSLELLRRLLEAEFNIENVELVAGATIRKGSRIERGPDRPRHKVLDDFPSPYLSGIFDWISADTIDAATIETNRGCPYSCAFCDWGSAIGQKIYQFDLDRVRAEINFLASRGVSTIWCADANFGIYPRDLEIARIIAASKLRFGKPDQFIVNYAKNASERIAEIVSILLEVGIQAQGTIAIQTMDGEVLNAVNRTNISLERYGELAQIFQDRNIPLATDLMIGLPGATIDGFKADLRHFLAENIPIKAFLTQVLPNSPMAAPGYIKQHAIELDSNGFIQSCRSFDQSELNFMIDLYRAYRALAGGAGLLKYVLHYARWDLELDPVDLLHDVIRSGPNSDYPTIQWAVECAIGHRAAPGGWRRLMEEADRLIRSRTVDADLSALPSVLMFQRQVLPLSGAKFPKEIALDYDFPEYFFNQIQARSNAVLTTYKPTKVMIRDPLGLSKLNSAYRRSNGGHILGEWELDSPLFKAADSGYTPKMMVQHVRKGPTFAFS